VHGRRPTGRRRGRDQRRRQGPRRRRPGHAPCHGHRRGDEGPRPVRRRGPPRLMDEQSTTTGPRVEEGVPLAPLTTMRVGGPAARLVTVETTYDLVDAVREVDDADEPLLVVGGGSNLVIAAAGFAGTVVHVVTDGVRVESADLCGGANVRVEAGTVWDDLVARSVEEGWAGIEALSGIPGSTGATPVQNVGAYGQEVAQTIAQVR